MKKINLIHLFLLVFSSSSFSESNIRFGVNGHPGVQQGYKDISIDAQLDLVKELGTTWYRTDWYQKSLEKDPAYYATLISEANKRNLKILPVIFPSVKCDSGDSLKKIRTESFTFAKNIVAKYKHDIKYWELANELDNCAILRKGDSIRIGKIWNNGTPSGQNITDYQDDRFRKVQAELIGLYEGVKAADSSALTIVDTAGWLHYGFLTRLNDGSVTPYDIIGWHWYSDMGDIRKVKGKINVLKNLESFGKPIWITEINRRKGDLNGKHNEQAEYLEKVGQEFSSDGNIKAFFVYELLDEPWHGEGNPESHYGLVTLKMSGEHKWSVEKLKPAFYSYKRLIKIFGK